MKVKNGIASSVSFSMMPNSRLGSACSSSGGSRPSSMPMKANSRPLAASAKAIGKPDSRKTTREPNMIGAMLSIRNCVIAVLAYGVAGGPERPPSVSAAAFSAGL